MSAMELFSNGEFELNVTPDGAGGFQVRAASIAAALGFRDGLAMTRSVPAGEKGYTLERGPNGEVQAIFLTEAGFYRVLGQRQAARIKDPGIRSQVERFQAWVFGVVLPGLRSGVLVPAQRQPAELDRRALAQMVLDAEDAKDAALTAKAESDQRAIEAEAKVVELAPAANAWNAIASGRGTCSVGEASKMLANVGIMIGQKELFNYLAEINWTFRKGKDKRAYWEAYSEHVQNGRLTMKYQSRPEYDEEGEIVGRQDAARQVRFKPKGIEDLLVLLTRKRLVQTMLELVSGGAR